MFDKESSLCARISVLDGCDVGRGFRCGVLGVYVFVVLFWVLCTHFCIHASMAQSRVYSNREKHMCIEHTFGF